MDGMLLIEKELLGQALEWEEEQEQALVQDKREQMVLDQVKQEQKKTLKHETSQSTGKMSTATMQMRLIYLCLMWHQTKSPALKIF